MDKYATYTIQRVYKRGDAKYIVLLTVAGILLLGLVMQSVAAEDAPADAATVQTDAASATDADFSTEDSSVSVEAEVEIQTQHMDELAATQGEKAVSSKIAADFAAFAGSEDNAQALASGLRNGTEITLSAPDAGGASVTFTPPTGHMGNGNVYKSLALAEQQLADIGITDPTPDQIQTALMGGSITVNDGANTTTHDMNGILQMRSDGMGWGRIAQANGAKLGTVMKSMKAANAHIENTADADVEVDVDVAASATSGADGAIVNAEGGAVRATAKSGAKGKTVGADGAVKTKGGHSAATAKSGHGHAKSRIVNAAGGSTVAVSGKTYSSHGSGGATTSAGHGGGQSVSAKGSSHGGNGHFKK
ncbi:MAG: hypothetical protein AB1469_07875 [Pseudomonadota bacterium]